jgi:hypothetical protein
MIHSRCLEHIINLATVDVMSCITKIAAIKNVLQHEWTLTLCNGDTSDRSGILLLYLSVSLHRSSLIAVRYLC